MKKIYYEKPELEVLEVQFESAILDGSVKLRLGMEDEAGESTESTNGGSF